MNYYLSLLEGVYARLAGVAGLAHYGLTATPARPSLSTLAQGGLPAAVVEIERIDWTLVTNLPNPIRLGVALIRVRLICELPTPPPGEPGLETPIITLLHEMAGALEGVISPLGEPAEILYEQAIRPTPLPGGAAGDKAAGRTRPRYEHHWMLRERVEAV